MAQQKTEAVPTIVVPLDGSENAERALPYARAFAARAGGTALLVSIVDVPVEFNAWAVTTAAGSQLDAWVDARRQYLERIAGTFEGVEARTSVELGGAATGIVDVARGATNPVVVMASHGRSGIRRLVLGSVASRVLADVECPVLLIHAADGVTTPTTAPTFERVLVPLDGSAFGEAVLERGLALLAGGLELHLVRVIDTPGLDVIGTDEPELSFNFGLVAEYLDACRQEASDYLQNISGDLMRRGYRVTSEVRDGDVAAEINRAAEAANADVIAMATHGRGGLSRLVMGSVAERVLHGATRPLLLVRPA